jgi:histidine triad (HIT) family protein
MYFNRLWEYDLKQPLERFWLEVYTLEIMTKSKDCIFCKIIAGEVPCDKVMEDKDLLVFHDIKPSAPVHVLIIPKKHIENLGTASKSDGNVLGKCQIAAGDAARKLGIAKNFRVATASGFDAGQRVFHLHYHLVGGWKKPMEEMNKGV